MNPTRMNPEIMNAEIKAQWVAALRSGKYQQTQRVLHDEEGMCCLGVLCDLYIKAHIGTAWIPNCVDEGGDYACFGFLDGSSRIQTLPTEVMDWAGLTSADPLLGTGFDAAPASQHNDGLGEDFQTIATLIEKNL